MGKPSAKAVFFDTYQGVREVDPMILNNARMLDARERQVVRHVLIPSVLTWIFSSLHISIRLAVVTVVVGEYWAPRGCGLSDVASRTHVRHDRRLRGHGRLKPGRACCEHWGGSSEALPAALETGTGVV